MRATKVNAGLAESNGRLLLGIWRDSLHVTCGLTACTPRSAPGPTLGNEYGKTLPFYMRRQVSGDSCPGGGQTPGHHAAAAAAAERVSLARSAPISPLRPHCR